MKKICLMVAILVTTLLQTGFAQHEHANNQTQTPALLPLYYNIKDALVGGNATLASSKANELVNALNLTEAKTITGDSGDELMKHAEKSPKAKT